MGRYRCVATEHTYSASRVHYSITHHIAGSASWHWMSLCGIYLHYRCKPTFQKEKAAYCQSAAGLQPVTICSNQMRLEVNTYTNRPSGCENYALCVFCPICNPAHTYRQTADLIAETQRSKSQSVSWPTERSERAKSLIGYLILKQAMNDNVNLPMGC